MTDPMSDQPGVPTALTRREVLRRVAVVGLGAAGGSLLGAGAALAATKTTKRTATTKRKAAATAPKASTANTTCVLTPEATEGPYYLNIDQVRTNITEGRPGTPLDLVLTVMDVAGCKPVKAAAVDIWQRDAAGVYSGVSGDRAMFLRGTQVSDASGLARFATIYPGSYPGRTVHIHVKVHVGGQDTYTGQLYFDDAVSDVVFKSAPYNLTTRRGRNTDDGIYRQSGAASTLALTAKGTGFVGALTLGIRP